MTPRQLASRLEAEGKNRLYIYQQTGLAKYKQQSVESKGRHAFSVLRDHVNRNYVRAPGLQVKARPVFTRVLNLQCPGLLHRDQIIRQMRDLDFEYVKVGTKRYFVGLTDR